MVPVGVRMRLWLGVGVAAVAAVVATSAFGVSGSDTITTIAGNGKPGFSGDGGPATSGAAVAAIAMTGVHGRAQAALGCTKAAATVAATRANVGVDPALGRTPIGQVICGAFVGPGSQAMAATVAVPAGCGVSIGWAVFRLQDGVWQLVMEQRNGVLLLEAVGTDIRTTQGYPRPRDERCDPSRIRMQTWHWNGSNFTPSAWKVTEAKERHMRHFRAPGGNVACEFYPGTVAGVACVTIRPPRYVSLRPGGRLEICLTYGDPCLFSNKIFTDGTKISAAPLLNNGQSNEQSGIRCVSARTGITCTLSGRRKGFRISNSGIARVG